MAVPAIKSPSPFLGKPINPVLKWAGGKRWFNTHMIEFSKLNQTDRMVEPFAGGMAISLAVKYEKTLVNDVNPHVINLYNQIKKGLSITITMEYDKKRYYKYRELFNKNINKGTINTPEMAQLFFYLNKTGFNGMCRFNRSGLFNVPFGKYKSVNYVRDFAQLKILFKDWTFSSVDFSEIETFKSDLIFVDGPYDDSFSDYSMDGFSWSDQERTALWSSQQEGPIIVTNKPTDRIIALYESLGFSIRVIEARRTISSKGDTRKPVLEMVAYKNVKVPDTFIKASREYKQALKEFKEAERLKEMESLENQEND